MKTFMAKKEEVTRKWFLLDAKDKIVGRVATRAAVILRGKNKTNFTPNVDTGDFVIIINADKVKLSGKKEEAKVYQSHSGYPGGFKEVKFKHLKAEKPERILEIAIKGMLPKTKLGDAVYKKLKVYKGEEHPHKAQSPIVLN
jgi:large subunit ribosomal protein L13